MMAHTLSTTPPDHTLPPRRWPCVLISCWLAACCSPAAEHPLLLGGNLLIHDPSTILRRDNSFWVFGTGSGVVTKTSPDLRNWTQGPPVFQAAPPWTTEVSPKSNGRFWAPDVTRVADRYYLYYSVSSWGSRESAIGLVIGRPPNPAAAGISWQDAGMVIRTSSKDDYNAIDPSVLPLGKDQLWMAFGSFWSGIKLVELNPETGLRRAPDSPIYDLAWHEAIEAPTLHQRGAFFYLFVNWGHCCRGTNSTYEIRVGRSPVVTGPYLDQDGKDLMAKGGTLVLATAGPRIGPGHAGLLSHQGKEYLSYHFYDGEDRGRAKLGITPLRWTAGGWPTVQPRSTAD